MKEKTIALPQGQGNMCQGGGCDWQHHMGSGRGRKRRGERRETWQQGGHRWPLAGLWSSKFGLKVSVGGKATSRNMK